jgi:transcriptional regulator with XRE-family HTH domain
MDKPAPREKLKTHFGERMRDARLTNNMTLAQVGKALGVGHGSVAKWERDENQPTLHHLVKLAELFDLPLHVLTAEKLSSIAAMLPEIEKLSEPKQRELAGLIKDFLRNAARG